jgi:hypothetical protein
MATRRQANVARRNIERAQARKELTIAHLRESVRRDFGDQGAHARERGGTAGHALEARARTQLDELARERSIAGRSKLGKSEPIDALRGRR